MALKGFETVSGTLSAVLFYLSRNRSAYTRLAHEIRSTFDTLDDIRTGSHLASCLFLTACINETMRISPTSSIALLREVSGEGAVVEGQLIPAGYRVGTSNYAIHHNPEYFPRPHSFVPERWLINSELGGVSIARHSAFVPFSVGSRECIGKTFSYRLLRIIVASLIWKFDFQIAENIADSWQGGGNPFGEKGRWNPEEYQLYERITSSGKGPWLQFKRRV